MKKVRRTGPVRLSAIALIAALLAAFPPAEAGARQQTDPQAAVQEAAGHLQAGRPAQAVEILEEVTSTIPDDPRAWALLGRAYHALERWDDAIRAHTRAAGFPSTRPAALYDLGMAHARKGEIDLAFQRLLEAKSTGAVDMTRAGLDPDAEPIRDDPRFRQLFPTAREFADPFVEPVEVLQEWTGEHAGDQFGWIARDIGDVDGDGIHDVVTSAPTWGEGGTRRGKVYSSGSGELLWSAEGREGDQLGLGVEAAGDVDGDGIPDVAAGAPDADRATIYSGGDGRVLHDLEGPEPGAWFGRKVGDIGDADGDGHDDVLVGAPRDDGAGEDAGRAYVYSGKDASILLTLEGEEAGDGFGSAGGGWTDQTGTLFAVGAPNAGPQDRGRVYVYRDLDPEPAFVIDSDEQGAMLGYMFISVVGDVDGDGMPDVYASDWSHGARGSNTGRIYVHSGRTGERLHVMTGESAGDGFGIGVADAGDVDRDGRADLVVGAWQYAGQAAAGGKIYIYSGRDGSLVRTITGKVMGETFGFDATGVGDVDGDGIPDLLLTSAWSAVRGPRSGRMFIISGAAPVDR